MSFLGGLISAGANLIGGYMGKQSADANRDMLINQAQQNMQLQKSFAKEGIRWKVADAKAAGIHPLYALGASTQSYSPVSLGNLPDNPMAAAVAAAGQDIGRAVNATRTQPERNDAIAKSIEELSVKNMALRNDLLSAQIAKLNQGGGNPPMPTLDPKDRSSQIFETAPPFVTPGKELAAEKVGDEYGEAAEDISGGIRFVRDGLIAHGVPLGKSPDEYTKLLFSWLLSDAAKTRVSIIPGSPLDKLLRALPAFGRYGEK